jgi:DNA-binding transcriptional MerR regulator
MTKPLDTSGSFVVNTSAMRGVSTAQAAKLIGVSTRTLFRWLDAKLLPEPKWVKMPGQEWRLWSAQDIARAKKVKAKSKRGPVPKKKS